MKDEDIKKVEARELENLKKLSEKDKTFIKQLFSEYLGSKNISESDIKKLSEAMSIKYPDTFHSIMAIVGDIYAITDQEKILKDNKELYEFLQELKSLYGPKIAECFIVSNWPKGIGSVEGQTTIEPQSKESFNRITIHRNDGKIFTMYQPFNATMDLFIGIFLIINGSLKEMSDLKMTTELPKGGIELIEKNMSEFKKYFKEIKIAKKSK